MFEFFKKRKTPSKTIVQDGVEYKFKKRKGAKFLRVTIKSKSSVFVTVPFSCPFEYAENFLKSKKDWVEEKLQTCTVGRIDENLKTRANNLIITTGLVDKPKTLSKEGIIQFIYPIGADFYSSEIQKEAKNAVKKALYVQAKKILPDRLEKLAQTFGFKYGRIALKTSKTRWGSCSFRNNINLNINLVNLEDDIIDYVLIHELCHTVEKNHGTGFWALVEKCLPNAKATRRRLKQEKMIV